MKKKPEKVSVYQKEISMQKDIIIQMGGRLEKAEQNDKLYSQQIKELDIKLNYTLLQVDKALRKVEAINS